MRPRIESCERDENEKEERGMRGIKIDHYTNRILIRFELKVVCINKYLKKMLHSM